jgi:hypothetical protein
MEDEVGFYRKEKKIMQNFFNKLSEERQGEAIILVETLLYRHFC